MMGQLTLGEALGLTALIAAKDRPRARRACARRLRLWLDTPGVAIDEAAYVAGALCALGGPHHAEAATFLRALVR
jgi:hypothetical protein